MAKTRAQTVSRQLRASAVAAYVARWSALLSAAAHRTFAASLLPQDLANQPNLEASPPPTQRPSGTQPRGTCQFPTFIPLAHGLSALRLLQIWGQGSINTVNNRIKPDSRGKGAWEKKHIKKIRDHKRRTRETRGFAKTEHQQVQSESAKEAPESTIRDHKRSTAETFAGQAWYLVALTHTLRGNFGTWRHRRSLCVASVALGDAGLALVARLVAVTPRL